MARREKTVLGKRRTAARHRNADERGCSCEEMEEIVRRGYDAYKDGDIEGILRDWDPNASFYLSGRNLIKWGGKHQGAQANRRAFQQMKEVLEVKEFEPIILFCCGEFILSLGFYTVKCKDSGRRFSGLFFHIFRFNEECKIEDVTSLYDARRLARMCPRARRFL